LNATTNDTAKTYELYHMMAQPTWYIIMVYHGYHVCYRVTL